MNLWLIVALFAAGLAFGVYVAVCWATGDGTK